MSSPPPSPPHSSACTLRVGLCEEYISASLVAIKLILCMRSAEHKITHVHSQGTANQPQTPSGVIASRKDRTWPFYRKKTQLQWERDTSSSSVCYSRVSKREAFLCWAHNNFSFYHPDRDQDRCSHFTCLPNNIFVLSCAFLFYCNLMLQFIWRMLIRSRKLDVRMLARIIKKGFCIKEKTKKMLFCRNIFLN